MAYHSNEDQFAENEQRAEMRRWREVVDPMEDEHRTEREWEQRLSKSRLLDNLISLAKRNNVSYWQKAGHLPDDTSYHLFQKGRTSVILMATSTGAKARIELSPKAEVVEKIVDIDSLGADMFDECFGT